MCIKQTEFRKKKRKVAKEVNTIDDIFKNIKPLATSESSTKKNREEQYAWGIVDETGVATLIKIMKPTSNDIFVDIGSGKGALCNQIFYESSTKCVIGIEALERRHKEAVSLFGGEETIVDERKLQFIFGDALLKTDVWANATLVFMHNFTFPDNVINNIFDIIDKNCCKKNGLRMIIMAKPPNELKYHEKYNKKMTERIKVNWGTTKFHVWTPIDGN